MREGGTIEHRLDGWETKCLTRVYRVIFELPCDVAMIRANHSNVPGKVCISCSSVLNKWTYAKNENQVWVV